MLYGAVVSVGDTVPATVASHVQCRSIWRGVAKSFPLTGDGLAGIFQWAWL